MNYRVFGEDGRDIILLHGWGHSGQDLLSLAELLSGGGFRVHLLDLPGFGASSVPESIWGSREYADCVEGYLAENNLEDVCLVGHSFGGRVSIALASSSQRVSKLVLINSSGIVLPRSWRKKCIRLHAFGMKLIDRVFGSDFFGRYFVPRFGSRDYLSAGPMRKILVRTVNEDLSQEARKVGADTLLLWGGNDRETPLEIAKRLSGMIQKSRLVVFPDKDHYLPNGGGAGLCADQIDLFLNA